jgi:hypothetical protein
LPINGQKKNNTGHFYYIMAGKLETGVIMAHKSKRLAALAVLKQIAEPVGISMLAARLGSVSPRSLRRWLNDWIEQGVIEKSGQGLILPLLLHFLPAWITTCDNRY